MEITVGVCCYKHKQDVILAVTTVSVNCHQNSVCHKSKHI